MTEINTDLPLDDIQKATALAQYAVAVTQLPATGDVIGPITQMEIAQKAFATSWEILTRETK